MPETDPLIPMAQPTPPVDGSSHGNSYNSSSSSKQQYYFLNKSDPSYQGGSTIATGQVVEGPPRNSTAEEFAPRPVGKHKRTPSEVMTPNTRIRKAQENGKTAMSSANGSGGAGGFLSKLFSAVGASVGGHDGSSSATLHHQQQAAAAATLKLRKAPIKIEPKVFFANERTFLAWMHLSVVLAGASIAILAFAESQNPVSQLYGIVLLPVAIAFIVYSMYQYTRRAKMIRTRHPGPYEDTVGPVVLGVMLMVSITAQFALKLYDLHLQ